MRGSFADDVVGFAEGGCHAAEVWLTKLETHLESHGPADTKKLLQDHQMTLAAAAYQGGLLLSQARGDLGPLRTALDAALTGAGA